MSSFEIVIQNVHDERDAERVYAMSQEIMRGQHDNLIAIGLRAARAKDKGVMQVLEQALELIRRTAESQYGQTVREKGGVLNVLPPQYEVFKKAYEHALAGDALFEFGAIYAAAAVRCGIAQLPYDFRGRI